MEEAQRMVSKLDKYNYKNRDLQVRMGNKKIHGKPYSFSTKIIGQKEIIFVAVVLKYM